MSKVSELPRPVKRSVGAEILSRLKARATAGPAEEALDSYIPELEGIVGRLDLHVDGRVLADAARKAIVLRVESADCDVDTWYRHHESFIRIEATRRMGPHVAAASTLYGAAFPHGLDFVDDYIPDENRECRNAIAVLRSPEHAPAVAAIELPQAWISKWESAVDESDAAFKDFQGKRVERSQHVGGGLDAETDFSDVIIRLRKYVESRASRSDKAKIAEGKELLAPLLEELKKARTDKLARATRRENDQKPSPAEGTPAKTAPAEGAPAKAAPAEGTSAKTAPADGAAAKAAPTEGTSAKTAPAEAAPAKDGAEPAGAAKPA